MFCELCLIPHTSLWLPPPPSPPQLGLSVHLTLMDPPLGERGGGRELPPFLRIGCGSHDEGVSFTSEPMLRKTHGKSNLNPLEFPYPTNSLNLWIMDKVAAATFPVPARQPRNSYGWGVWTGQRTGVWLFPSLFFHFILLFLYFEFYKFIFLLFHGMHL